MKIRELLNELVYPGNIGIMELAKFFKVATDEQKNHFKKLKESNPEEAWEYMQEVIGVKLEK
jgi:hypothetical protein